MDERLAMTEQIVFRDGETGRALVSGSGAPVDEIIEAIASGQTMGEVMAAHPGLDFDGIAAALRFAGWSANMGYRAELIRGLLEAEAELDAGLGRPHEDVFDDLLQTYASSSGQPAG